jgi:hypothetical protein
MAEIRTITRTLLRGERFEYYIKGDNLSIGFISNDGSTLIEIPLDEFDELVSFVEEHRQHQAPTRAPEDFIREAEESKL